MLLGALRDGPGWRRVEVESAAGERVPLHIAPQKTPRSRKTETAGNKLINELRTRYPPAAWRLLREGRTISAGYRQLVLIVAESSTKVRFEFDPKALENQRLPREDPQAVSEAMARTASVQSRDWRGLPRHTLGLVECARSQPLHCEGSVRQSGIRQASRRKDGDPETGATSIGLRQLLRSVEAAHWIAASGGSDSAEGATVLVARTLCKARPPIVELVRGWVMEVRVANGDGEVVLICVHNHDVGNGARHDGPPQSAGVGASMPARVAYG